jgi:hypothetical protein
VIRLMGGRFKRHKTTPEKVAANVIWTVANKDGGSAIHQYSTVL